MTDEMAKNDALTSFKLTLRGLKIRRSVLVYSLGLEDLEFVPCCAKCFEVNPVLVRLAL